MKKLLSFFMHENDEDTTFDPLLNKMNFADLGLLPFKEISHLMCLLMLDIDVRYSSITCALISHTVLSHVFNTVSVAFSAILIVKNDNSHFA